MKVIEYKGKKLKLPYDLKDGELSTELVTRQNPFSGRSIELPEFAAVVYDTCVQLNHRAEEIDRATHNKNNRAHQPSHNTSIKCLEHTSHHRQDCGRLCTSRRAMGN